MPLGYKSMLIRMLDGYSQVVVPWSQHDTSPRSPHGRTVLQVGPLKPSLAQTLQDDYAAYVLPDESDGRAAFLSTHGEEITAVVTGAHRRRRRLDVALPKLGAVVNFGVGHDTTDVGAAAERGVAVSNTPDVLTDASQTPP